MFHVDNNLLQSTLLMSSAVQIQLHFSNFKIAVKTTAICPKFDSEEIMISGCYNCPVISRQSFTVHSTCQAGVVLVNFQQISTHTKHIHLTVEPILPIIKFVAQQKCYFEKLFKIKQLNSI